MVENAFAGFKAKLEESLKEADVQGLDQSQQRETRKKVDRRLRELWPKLELWLPPGAAPPPPPDQQAGGGEGLGPGGWSELLVMLGECAVKVRSTSLAVTAITTLLQRLPPLPREALLVRALCVQAWAKAALGSHLRAVDGINHVLKAVAYILQALEVALLPEVKAQAPYLVYNVSVYYYNIVRPAFREGAFRHLVPSLAKVVEAMEASQDWDRRWRMQLLGTLAMAHDDAGQIAQAAAKVTSASQMAREVLEGEKAKAAADSAALQLIHKEMDAVRVKIRQLDKALEAAYTTSENPHQTEEARAAALEEIPRLREEVQAVREGELKEKEARLRDAETRLEVSIKVQREAAAAVEGLLVQRLYLGRRGDSDGKKLVDAVKAEVNKENSLRLKVLVAGQGVKAGLIGAAEAEKELIPLMTQAKAAASTADGLEAVAELGLAAARAGQTAMALDALDTVLKAKTQAPVVRVKLDYLKCLLMASEAWLPDKGPSAKTSERLDERHRQALAMARRAEVVRTLERALMAAKRLDHAVPLLVDGCVMAWNLCLPLLEPHLRKQTQRLLQFAAVELERLDLPLYQLRALIHTELGKLELSVDLLANAMAEIDKAIGFDFSEPEPVRAPTPNTRADAKANAAASATAALSNEPVVVTNPPVDTSATGWAEPPPDKPPPTAEQEAENERLRPLDRFLLPLQLRLSLKASIYSVSEDRADKALVMIEQARDAKDPEVRLRILDRAALLLKTFDKPAIATLTAASEAQQPVEEPDSFLPPLLKRFTTVEAEAAVAANSREAPQPRRKTVAGLWASIAELAWQVKDVELLHDAALRVLDELWHPLKYKDLYTQQVKTQYMFAESLVELLLEEGSNLPPPELTDPETSSAPPPPPYDPLMLGVNYTDLDPRLIELKKAVVTTLVAGMRRAVKTGDAYLVENGCVYLWNYHLPALKKRLDSALLPDLLTGFESALSVLKEVKSSDTVLSTTLAEALCLSYEGRGEMAKAVEVATAYIPLGRPFKVKGMAAALARASLGKAAVPATGGKESGGGKKGAAAAALGVHPDAKLLDAMAAVTAAGLAAVTDKERDDALAKASALLEEDKKNAASRPAPTTVEDFDEGLELRAELWCQLADRQLRRAAYRKAQAACESCLALLPSDPADLAAALKPRLLRWLSVAECLWGRSIAAMVDPLNQDKALQEQLRVTALGHLVEAGRYGAQAKLPALVLEAARQLWTASAPMHESAVSRCDIFGHVLRMLTHLLEAKDKAGMRLTARLYALAFQCYADEKRWDEGLRFVTQAFTHVPLSHAKPLWQWKVVFMSKKGLPVLDGIAKMKEADPVLQARVWGALAKSSSQPRQQLEAYMKILEVLSARFERTAYYIEAAEWLLTRGLPKAKARQLLQAAVDTVLEAEIGDADEEALEDGRSQASRSQGGESARLSSRGGARSETGGLRRAGSQKSLRSSTRRSTRGPGSTRSRTPRSMSGRSARGGAASSKAGTAVGADGSPLNLGATHYELVVRALAMQAQLASKSSERRELCLQACAYAGSIVTALLHSINSAARKEAFLKLSREEQALTSPEAMAFDPPFPPPTTTISLCLLPVTAELLAAARQLSINKRLRQHAISPRSFPRAPVTLHHLSWVAETLTSYGLDLHAGACLSLAHLISELAPPAPLPFLGLLSRCRRARLLTRLGQNDAATALLQAPSAVPLGLDSSLVQQNLGDVEERERQLRARRERAEQQPAAAAASSPSSQGDDMVVKGFETRHLWAALAEECAVMGHQRAAMEYLTAAARHNHAYEDEKNQAYCARIKAGLEFAQGRTSIATSHLLLSMHKQGATGDAAAWSRLSCLLADLLLAADEEGEAEKVLTRASNALLARTAGPWPPGVSAGSLATPSAASHTAPTRSSAGPLPTVKTPGSEDGDEGAGLDVLAAWAQCSLKLAVLQANKLLRQVRRTRSLSSASLLSEPFGLFQAVERRLTDGAKGGGGAHPMALEAVLQQARTALQAYETLAWLQGQSPSTQDLMGVRACYCKALRLLTEMQASALPPRTLLSDSLPPSAPPLTLPVSRRLAEAQAELAGLDTMLARAHREHTSLATERRESAAIADAAQRWLAEAAPKPELNDQTLSVKFSEEAVALGVSALALAQGNLPLTSSAASAVGTGHLIVSMGQGTLDEVWAAAAPPANPAATPGGERRVSEVGSRKSSAASIKSVAKEDAKAAAAGEAPMASTLAMATPPSELALKQAVEEGVRAEAWLAVASAAAGLVELYGASRSKEAVASLMQHQSCAIRPFLLRTFLAAADDTDRQAIFIKQAMDRAAQGDNATGPWQQYLKEHCFAWRRLDCSARPTDLIDKLPPGLWLLSLQVDPGRTFLYAGGVGPGGASAAIARMALRENERSQLLELQRRMAQLRREMVKHMLLYGDEAGMYGDLCQPPASSADSVTSTVAPPRRASQEASSRKASNESVMSNNTAATTVPGFADHLEAELKRVLAMADALMQPLLSGPEISGFLSSVSSSPKAAMVLLLGQDFLPLPMEGLTAFKPLTSVSRDFSLHVLCHRMATAKEVNPGKEVMEVKAADMSFMADPRVEDTGSASKVYPRPTVLQTMEEVKKVHGSLWKGVTGRDRTPATWEWQAAVGKRAGGGFLYYGPGRTLAHFPPKALVGLSAKGCQVCVLVDQADNDASFRRQSKLDTGKTARELQSEQSLEAAVLLTLSGVNAITTNQWASSFHANGRLVTRLFDAWVKGKQQLGEAAREAAGAAVTVPRPDFVPGSTVGTKRNSKADAMAAGPANLTLTVKARVAYNTVTYGVPSFVIV